MSRNDAPDVIPGVGAQGLPRARQRMQHRRLRSLSAWLIASAGLWPGGCAHSDAGRGRPVDAPAICAFSTGGCAPSEAAREQLDRRLDSLRRSLSFAWRSEQWHADNLRRAPGHVHEVLREDAAQLQANARRGAEDFRDNAERFRRRQREYQEELRRILGGKPERILLTALRLFI